MTNTPENAVSTTTPSPKRRKGHLIFFLFMLLCLGFIAGSGYYFYPQLITKFNLQNENKASISDLLSRVEALEMKVAAPQPETGSLPEASNQLLWDEARYYVSMAAATYTVTHSTDNTLSLLNLADARLAQSQIPQAAAIRETIAKKITEIKSITQIDNEGLTVRLNALGSQIAVSLVPTSRKTPSVQPSVEMPNKTSSETVWWKKMWEHTSTAVGQVIVVRHQDESLQPLLGETQLAMLRENSALTIELAKSAVLKRDNDLYQHSLEGIKILIQKYIPEQALKQTLLEEAAALSAISVTTQPVDFNDILTQFTAAR